MKLDKINKDNIRFACYLIVGKIMKHFMRNECTLDIISITDHCCQGEIINLLAFVLNELFEACECVYRRGTGFVFGYLVMALGMWKWRPPPERQMETIAEDQPIALKYEPWRASWDPITKEINGRAFKSWYAQMVDAIQSMERIPRTLLDEFSGELWFDSSHTHTYLRLRCVNPTTFKLRPQRFSLTEEALHREVES